MPKKMTKECAESFLRDVAPEQCFWVNNGPIIGNLSSLPKALKEISKETFLHHVNKDKNDFTVWINDVIGDKALAGELLKVKSKDALLKKIEARAKLLKKIAGGA